MNDSWKYQTQQTKTNRTMATLIFTEHQWTIMHHNYPDIIHEISEPVCIKARLQLWTLRFGLDDVGWCIIWLNSMSHLVEENESPGGK